MVLLFTAIAVGCMHTLLGPDHYLPFIVIGRARRWGLGATSLLTFACGLGHVLSSVAIGLAGAFVGATLSRVQAWESTRGAWAGWALLVFGAAYMAWGTWRAVRRKSHDHWHLHPTGVMHHHGHAHESGHAPVHEHDHAGSPEGSVASWKSLTPWILFLIFVLGPCEPLVPLFFASAVSGTWHEVVLVTVGYSVATLATMHAVVTLMWLGLRAIPLGPLEKWSSTAAGALILVAGVAMVFLGL